MFPYGFVNWRKKTDYGVVSGPVVYKMRQSSCDQDKKSADDSVVF